MKNTPYRILALALSLGMFGLVKSSEAATYYVCDTGTTCGSGWATGNDSNAGSSKSTPGKTIKGGISRMSAGDTLIIGDGTYQGDSNMLSNPAGDWDIGSKSGSSGGYTVIKAENDWGAIIDGQNSRYTGWITGFSYGIIRSIHFRNSNGYGLRLHGSSHTKVLRCAFEEQKSFGLAFTASSNCLAEQNVAYGCGTYFISDNNYWGANDRNIYRSNVVRRDAHYHSGGTPDGGNHYASYNTYWSPTSNVYFQDDISLDSGIVRCGEAMDPYYSAALYGANGNTAGFTVDGLVAVNENGFAGEFESGGKPTIRNSAFYVTGSRGGGILSYGPGTFENILVSGATSGQYQMGVWQVQGTITSLKNNIIYGNSIGLAGVSGAHSYNDLFNTNNYDSTSAGTGDKTYNPLTNGLLYPVRVEAGSNLAKDGSGGRIGPEIIYRIGRTASSDTECGGSADGMSCRLYGETGWDELQDGQSGRALVKLWPFPNEGKIKSMMSAYNLHGANGKRGFAADGNGLYGGPITLTSYIWEYLGNPCPAEICNYGQSGDTTPPSAPKGLSVR